VLFHLCLLLSLHTATKRKKLTILEKVNIIQEVENNPNMTVIEIVQKFNGRKKCSHCVY
jgi:hypothetical protein